MEQARFNYLLEQIRTRKAIPEEYDELLHIIKTDQSEDMIPLLDAYHARYADNTYNNYDDPEWDHLLDQILDADKVKVSKVRSIRYKWWMAAAVLLLMVGITYFLSVPKEKSPISVVITKDIQPGGNKAVLTLSNGKEIVLDSTVNGILARDNNANVVKTDEGKIAYQTAANVNGGALIYNKLSTPRGGQYQLVLPDGTHVWLNAASSIRYPTIFSTDRREVTITGEVYFEVAKNEQKPFYVTVGTVRVEVLGTHFNIKAYDHVVRTTLLEGAVRVSDGTQSKLLSPLQQVIAGNGQLQLLTEINAEDVVSWKDGLFNFNGADIRDIMQEAARWYDIDVVFENGISDEKFRGKVPMNTTLNEMMKILSLNGVKYSLNGNQVIIKK